MVRFAVSFSWVLGFILLAACGKDSGAGQPSVESRDRDGNCTESFISDHNNVTGELQLASAILRSDAYSTAEKVEKLRTVQNACHRFFANHPGVSCNAEVNYQEKIVNSSALKSPCDAVDEFFTKYKP